MISFRAGTMGRIFLLMLGMGWALPSHDLKGINPDGTLDKPTISKAYFEGEFWTVTNALEEFRKGKLKSSGRDDSIYTFKYLSVVYAAEPSSRAKAESYMYMLLKMMPTIDLLDLYISDNIESVFQKVRRDFERMHKLESQTAGTPSQGSKSDTSSIAKSSKPDSSQNGAAGAASTVSPNKSTTDSARVSQTSTASNDASGTALKSHRIKPWVWFAIGGGTAASVATYFIVADASSHKTTPSNPTWDVQVKPSP